MRARLLLSCSALLLALFAGGCGSTTILLADPESGFEARGPRTLRLRFETLGLDIERDDGGARPAVAVEYALAPAAGTDAGALDGEPAVLEFRLPFVAWNGSEEPWRIVDSAFFLGAAGDGPTPELRRLDGGEPMVLATVAPGSGARFDVPFRLRAAAGRELFVGSYRLRASDRGGDLLQRTLHLDHFDQLSQVARFVGFGVLFLALLAALG